ncbi:MAG: DUF4331 family protein [Candidatus Dormibacteraeota bacterium]|nr:DUF4331 family protein [Candidatus Dormibacteraeota bacterium]MBV9524965.1 DUF4331 family protein [Candidatus Dormibacteraeota bacterium]
MADHLDAPGLKSPFGDAKTDITDIYIFQKPGDDDKSILILNVNPLAPTLATEFQHSAAYDMLIDTDGDARADIGYRITFTEKDDGKQWADVEKTRRAPSMELDHDGEDHEPIIDHAPVSFGSSEHITEGEDGYKFFAGFRSDPFFFDLLAFLAGLKFHNPGSDFFIDKNVFSIVLEVPNRRGLGENPNVGYWARTLIPMGNGDDLGQDDQMGRPAINTVFNHGTAKNLFNATPPDQQRALFLSSFVSTLEALGGYSATQATGIADILLPDILTYNYNNSSGFLNGRKLTDDVIDAELSLVSNGAITSDFVGPHTDYLTHFPYVGKPH